MDLKATDTHPYWWKVEWFKHFLVDEIKDETQLVEVKQQKTHMEIDRHMPEYVIAEPHF